MKDLFSQTMILQSVFRTSYMERAVIMTRMALFPARPRNLQTWSLRKNGVTIRHVEASNGTQTTCGMYVLITGIAHIFVNKPQIRTMASWIRTSSSVKSKEPIGHLSQVQPISNEPTMVVSNENVEGQMHLKMTQQRC